MRVLPSIRVATLWTWSCASSSLKQHHYSPILVILSFSTAATTARLTRQRKSSCKQTSLPSLNMAPSMKLQVSPLWSSNPQKRYHQKCLNRVSRISLQLTRWRLRLLVSGRTQQEIPKTKCKINSHRALWSQETIRERARLSIKC